MLGTQVSDESTTFFFQCFGLRKKQKSADFGCAKLKLTGWLNHTFASFVHSTTVAFIQPDATVLPSTHQTKLAKVEKIPKILVRKGKFLAFGKK